MQMLTTLPTPVITSLINTVGMIVNSNDPDIKAEMEGFKSDAQRRAAFASGYKAKGKKGKDKKDK